jgi:hypothetical protein
MKKAKESEGTKLINEFINYLMVYHLQQIHDYDTHYQAHLQNQGKGEENYDSMYSQQVEDSVFY